MSYNIVHDDDSGAKPQQWNNIKVNKMTCSELFLANGFDTQFYVGAGPNLTLYNALLNTVIPTTPIDTVVQRFGNVVTLHIKAYIVSAGSTTPAPYDLKSGSPSIFTPTIISSYVCPYSHVLGPAALDTLTYKMTVTLAPAELSIRMRNNGTGLNSENFDNTDSIEFFSTSLTYLLS